MTAALDRCTASLGNGNVRAFLHVIREGETNQTDDAFRMLYGGALQPVPPWVHPYYGRTTTEVGHSTAFGAYQFLGTSFKEASDALGLGNDASPVNQDLCSVWTIDAKRHALAEVMGGDVAGAIAKLANEWVSLPGLGLERATKVFKQHGGTVGGATAPADTPSESAPAGPATPQQPEKPMGALALLQMFAPMLSGLIPQISPLLQPGSKAEKLAPIAQLVIDTITKATGQSSLGGAVQAMQSDPALTKTVQTAVVTEPKIMESMTIGEVGGGVAAARDWDAQERRSEVPFWKGSAVFYMSLLLLPLVYWLVGSLIIGGYGQTLAVQNVTIPEWAQAVLAIFGASWTGEARSGGFNLVIGLVLGGICGVYYGVSVTQQKQQGAQSPDIKP